MIQGIQTALILDNPAIQASFTSEEMESEEESHIRAYAETTPGCGAHKLGTRASIRWSGIRTLRGNTDVGMETDPEVRYRGQYKR